MLTTFSMQAIYHLYRKHPWVRHNDASHEAVGDVARSCAAIAWASPNDVRFAVLPYFKI